MNIFVLSLDPSEAARFHCDTHVVKMVLESAQILCGAAHLAGKSEPWHYRATHLAHPCVKWAAESRANFKWLAELADALAEEYTHRYRKVHASSEIIRRMLAAPPPGPRKPLTPFALAMPEEFHRPDPVEAYRLYYHHKAMTLRRFAFTRRAAPPWMRFDCLVIGDPDQG